MGIQGNYNSFFTCYLKVFLDRFFENLESVQDDSIPHYFFVYIFEIHIAQKKFAKYMDAVTFTGWEKSLLATCFCFFLK